MKKKIYSIGIDVSKKTLDICFMKKDMSVVSEFKIKNNTVGIANLMQRIKRISSQEPREIILESTGNYHILCCICLNQNNFNIKLINPLMAKKYSAGASIRNCKNDRIDARKLAEIGIRHGKNISKFKISVENIILKKKIALLNFFLKKLQATQATLQQYQEVAEELKIEPEKSYEDMQKTIKQDKLTIKQLEKEILECGKKIKGFKLISSIKGISEKTTSIILSQLSEKEFRTKYSLTAFAGLDVNVRKSGTSINGKVRISKKGNAVLRKALTQAAWGLQMHNEYFQRLRNYYQSKGRHYFEILVILARKLLHIMYGMLKNNSHFDFAKLTIPSHHVDFSV